MMMNNVNSAMIALQNQPVNAQDRKMADVMAAAKDFEALFVSEMMNHMFSGIETDPMFGGGKGEEMFRSMTIQEYGKMIANGPGVGISDQIAKAMIELQEKQQIQ